MILLAQVNSISIVDSKVELREDFDRLKISYDNQKNETDLLRNDFHQLIENSK